MLDKSNLKKPWLTRLMLDFGHVVCIRPRFSLLLLMRWPHASFRLGVPEKKPRQQTCQGWCTMFYRQIICVNLNFPENFSFIYESLVFHAMPCKHIKKQNQQKTLQLLVFCALFCLIPFVEWCLQVIFWWIWQGEAINYRIYAWKRRNPVTVSEGDVHLS